MSIKDTEAVQLELEQELSRYFDGELSEEEAARVELRLQNDPEAQALLETFSRTQTSMRETYFAEAAQVDFGALWKGIEAGIDALPSPAVREVPVRVAVRPGLLERFMDWVRSLGLQPVGYGLAMAAVGMLVLGVSYLSVDEVHMAYHIPHMMPPGEMDIDPATGNIPPVADAQAEAADGLALVMDDSDVITEGVEVQDLSGDESTSLMILSSDEPVTIIWVSEGDDQEMSI